MDNTYYGVLFLLRGNGFFFLDEGVDGAQSGSKASVAVDVFSYWRFSFIFKDDLL